VFRVSPDGGNRMTVFEPYQPDDALPRVGPGAMARAYLRDRRYPADRPPRLGGTLSAIQEEGPVDKLGFRWRLHRWNPVLDLSVKGGQR